VNKTRALIVAAVVVVFVVAGGVLIYANQSRGGQAVTINLNVTGGTSMAPESPTAHQNDKVTINMTSDTDGEVHLHGYDIPFEVKAGETVSRTFTADKTGNFLIEWEATSKELGHLVVT